MELKSEGICTYCNKTIAGRAMARHLVSCIKRKEVNETERSSGKVLLLEARALPFFIYFEIDGSSTLRDIDEFLRSLWLECCGHLSAFTINNIRYCDSESDFMDDEKEMDVAVTEVLKPGMRFIHEYDFGTTTLLEMRVIAERNGERGDINILARNNMPNFVCDKCKKEAKEVCPQCVWEGKGLLCNACAKTHECGEDMLLPLVNSPRTGMCGYTGRD